MVHQAPCRRPPSAVSWPSSRSCCSAHLPCRRPCRALCCTPCRTPCHQAPAGAAASLVAASSVVSCATRSYRGACPAVSQHCIATQPAARPSSCHDTNDCIVTHPTSQASLLSRYNRLYRDTPQRPGRSCHDTIDCITTHPTSQATRERYHMPLRAAGRVVACLGRIAGPPRSYRKALLHAPTRLCPCLSRYNTLYRDTRLENGQ